ncbi:MAG TPA: hypothetical protein VGR55_00570 [Candidatus Acidoferrum sp.]|nr:hypothetical protein [Candidatus Acidoferrum sp.]
MSKRKKPEPIVVRAIVEFYVESDEVENESELVSGLKGELVKVKSGIYENQFMGGIIEASIQRQQKTTTARSTQFKH